MHTRGRSKKRTEDIDMEDKEATPVEEVEMIERDAQGDQPEKPTQPKPEAEAIAGYGRKSAGQKYTNRRDEIG